jgi:hypothetical protein
MTLAKETLAKLAQMAETPYFQEKVGIPAFRPERPMDRIQQKLDAIAGR